MRPAGENNRRTTHPHNYVARPLPIVSAVRLCRRPALRMTFGMIEPETDTFTRSEWLAALRDLWLLCTDEEPGHTKKRVREMNVLLRWAPCDADLAGVCALASPRLTALLDLDAGESALMAMLGQGTGLLLSRGGDGHSFATVALSGSVMEQSCSGATAALALIGALALSLHEAQSARPLQPRNRVQSCPVLH